MKNVKAKPYVSHNALDDARKCLGKGKYNTRGNYLVGDGYFAMDCEKRHGKEVWDEACKIVEREAN